MNLHKKALELSFLEYKKNKKNAPLITYKGEDKETGRIKFSSGFGGGYGIRLFNSSVTPGVPIQGVMGANTYYLDYRKHIPKYYRKISKKHKYQDTYIISIIDASGSMDYFTPIIYSALNKLKAKLKKEIFKSDKKTEKYFKIIYSGGEDWLRWPSYYTQELSRFILLNFINESSPTYHSNGGLPEPYPPYILDYNDFIELMHSKLFFKGIVYCVKGDFYFEKHITNAIEGINEYSDFNNLKALGWSYKFISNVINENEFYDYIIGYLGI